MVHLDNNFCDFICYTKKLVVTRIIQFSQRNGKLPSPQWKQGNYPVIPIYAKHYWYDNIYILKNDWITDPTIPLLLGGGYNKCIKTRNYVFTCTSLSLKISNIKASIYISVVLWPWNHSKNFWATQPQPPYQSEQNP